MPATLATFASILKEFYIGPILSTYLVTLASTSVAKPVLVLLLQARFPRLESRDMSVFRFKPPSSTVASKSQVPLSLLRRRVVLARSSATPMLR